MKVLFSPAESKKSGGDYQKISHESFLFPELYPYRKEILEKYNNFIQNASYEELSKLFGIKDSKKFESYKKDIFSQPIMKPIERYDGVAYDYLNYNGLKKEAQDFIDKNVIIFSNLYGPILAGDMGIVEYKLKQGEKLDGLDLAKYYKQYFSKKLDEYLENEFILDLRAKYYEKFYLPNKEYVTCKFLKNGKVVSHWAKAYRGLILREVAQQQPQTIEEFTSMDIPNLTIREIIEKKNQKEYIYEINN